MRSTVGRALAVRQVRRLDVTVHDTGRLHLGQHLEQVAAPEGETVQADPPGLAQLRGQGPLAGDLHQQTASPADSERTVEQAHDECRAGQRAKGSGFVLEPSRPVVVARGLEHRLATVGESDEQGHRRAAGAEQAPDDQVAVQDGPGLGVERIQVGAWAGPAR